MTEVNTYGRDEAEQDAPATLFNRSPIAGLPEQEDARRSR
jgi:hypothetical protein